MDDPERQRLQRKARRHDRRRAEIARAAEALLETHGEDFSLQQLAERLSISEGSVFYYFPGGRDEILIEAAWSFFERANEDLRKRCGSLEGAEAVAEVIRMRLHQYLRHPHQMAVIVRGLLHAQLTPERMESLYREVNSIFDVVEAAYVRGGVPEGADPRRLVHAVHFMSSGLLLADVLRTRGGGASRHALEQLGDEIIGLVLRGAAPGRDAS